MFYELTIFYYTLHLLPHFIFQRAQVLGHINQSIRNHLWIRGSLPGSETIFHQLAVENCIYSVEIDYHKSKFNWSLDVKNTYLLIVSL